MARDSSGNVIVVALGGGSIDLGNSITLSASSKLIYAKINPSTGVASSGVLLSSSTFDGSCGFALYANDTGVGCAVASSSVTLGSTTLSPTNPDVAICKCLCSDAFQTSACMQLTRLLLSVFSPRSPILERWHSSIRFLDG